MRFKIKDIPKYVTPGMLKEKIKKEFKVESRDFKIQYNNSRNYGYVIFKEKTIEESLKKLQTPILLNIRNNKKLEMVEVSDIQYQKEDVVVENIHINDIITPLWRLPYEEQISVKKKEVQKFYENVYFKDINIQPSTTKHRNNYQFAFGFNSEEQPTLGFRGTKFTNNKNLIFEIQDCVNVSELTKSKIIQIEKLLNNKNHLVFDRITGKGFLKLAMIREIGKEDICLISINSEQHEWKNNEDLVEIIENLPYLNLFVQEDKSTFEGFKNTNNVYRIRGEDTLIQELLEFKFKVSLFSFFQINVEIAEFLILKIKELMNPTNMLIDMCCGTGLFSICLSGSFKEVSGIEINEESIKNAVENAKLNKIENIKFINQDVILFEEPNVPCTVILDPPRSGVNKKVIRKIRDLENVNEIFFISCNYRLSYQNIQDLCKETTNSYRNKPFNIVNIFGFDMFPGTKDLEILIHLRRED